MTLPTLLAVSWYVMRSPGSVRSLAPTTVMSTAPCLTSASAGSFVIAVSFGVSTGGVWLLSAAATLCKVPASMSAWVSV